MLKRKMIPFLVIGALALAALGAFAVHTVNAQTPTPTTPNQAAPGGQAAPDEQAVPDRGLRMHGPKGERGGYTDEDIAAALGIGVDQLQAAYETAQNKALNQAVSQGLITQEQADQIKARGAGRFIGGRWLKDSTIDYDALLADALGISVDELQVARTEAFVTAVDRAVAAGTLTQEQADLIKGQQALQNDDKFQASMQSAFEAAVAQAVQDGVITQAQADQILANRTGRGFPFLGGGRHGFGGRGGHGLPGGAPDAPVTPTTPSGDGA